MNTIVKDSLKGKIKGKAMSKLDGFEVKPKNALTNKNVLEVKQINLVKKDMVKNVIIKKVYLKMTDIIEQINNDEESNPTDLKKSLGEIERLRSITINKYKKYLDRKDFEDLINKMNLLLQEIGIRTIAKQDEILRNSVDNDIRSR